MNFKAIFLDLDGTLLNDDKCLPQVNIDALSQASENGVKDKHFPQKAAVSRMKPMTQYGSLFLNYVFLTRNPWFASSF